MPERRRAQHRKSRRGCLQCKQRHTKCDETRPECVNCTVVGRQCRYAEVQVSSRAQSKGQGGASSVEVPAQSPTHAAALPHDLGADYPSPASTSTVAVGGHLTAATASTGSPVSPAWSHTNASSRFTHPSPTVFQHDEVHMHDVSGRGSIASSSHLDGTASSPHDVAGTSVDHEVNTNHTELLIHFFLTKAAAFTDSESQNDLVELGTNLILQKSMTNTTLLYQVLAISARYLSLKRPERHAFYAHQAVQLQTKAIELFNQTQTIDESNCEAMLLFSSLLNRQVLADALSNREGGFPAFLDRFIQAGHLQRGIRVVSRETWPLLLKSDLSALLHSCDARRVNRQGTGTECEMLRQLIAVSSTLDPISREACRSAIHFLQIGFDDVHKESRGYTAYNMVYSWFVLFPKEFVTLLTQHKPEALAILGFYAVLLHHSRDNWVVGDSGAFLLRGVSDYLGMEWAHWLEWPLKQLSETGTS